MSNWKIRPQRDLNYTEPWATIPIVIMDKVPELFNFHATTSKSSVIPAFLTGMLCCLINVCKAFSIPWVKDTTKEQSIIMF